jgi:hypothetical protein
MAEFQDRHYPDDVREIADRLDARRPDVSDLELDAVKLQAMKQVRRSAGGGRRTKPMNRRGLLAPVMMIAILLCGTGATLALSGQFSSKESASQKQYGPPPGCGKNKDKKGKRKECKRKCPKSHRKRCTVRGTNGDDHMRGGRRGDTFYGGRGNDRIYARHGGRDVIHCGGGRDVVYADYNDKVSKDCEIVHRSKKPKKKKHTHPTALTQNGSRRH